MTSSGKLSDYSTGKKFTQKYQCELGHVDIRVLEFNAKEVFIREIGRGSRK